MYIYWLKTILQSSIFCSLFFLFQHLLKHKDHYAVKDLHVFCIITINFSFYGSGSLLLGVTMFVSNMWHIKIPNIDSVLEEMKP